MSEGTNIKFTLTKRAVGLLETAEPALKFWRTPGKIKDTFYVTVPDKEAAILLITHFATVINNGGGLGKFANPDTTSAFAAVQRIRLALGYKGDVRHYNHTR